MPLALHLCQILHACMGFPPHFENEASPRDGFDIDRPQSASTEQNEIRRSVRQRAGPVTMVVPEPPHARRHCSSTILAMETTVVGTIAVHETVVKRIPGTELFF